MQGHVNGGTFGHDQVRALYEAHGRVLLAYAVSLLRDRSASEDVLQQVFVKLLNGRVAVSGSPLHYLYRAVRNTALNHRRNHAREVDLPSNGHWLESPQGKRLLASRCNRLWRNCLRSSGRSWCCASGAS